MTKDRRARRCPGVPGDFRESGGAKLDAVVDDPGDHLIERTARHREQRQGEQQAMARYQSGPGREEWAVNYYRIFVPRHTSPFLRRFELRDRLPFAKLRVPVLMDSIKAGYTDLN